MVNAKVKLTWAPSAVTAAIRREVKTAVRKGGERVARETKQALNVSGKGSVTRTGLNRLTSAQKKGRSVTEQNNLIRSIGMSKISNLKTVTSKRTGASISFGGSYKGLDRIYWNNDKKWWTTASPPGTPPHKQSGELQRRISVQPVNEGYRAKVGPANNLKYGRIQELGGKGLIRLAARPYLEPSFQKMVPAIMQDFRVAIAKATS